MKSCKNIHLGFGECFNLGYFYASQSNEHLVKPSHVFAIFYARRECYPKHDFRIEQ